MSPLLKTPITVRLDQLYLDPNNPRLARESRPGYGDPQALFAAELQAELERQLRNRYRLSGLVRAILGMGWLPVDTLLVWHPPETPGRFLVVEGNTRVVALRTIRRGLERERTRLLRARALGDDAQVKDATERAARHERVVAASERLEVHPLQAANPAELAQSVPPLLGVRHLAHAQEWGAWAVNLYLLFLYRELWAEERGNAPLCLDDAMLARVSARAALSPGRTRRSIQTVTTFLHFRERFLGRLPEGESFSDDDQSFFARLVEPGHARDQFRIQNEDLALRPEMEEVFFSWAFAHPRRQVESEPGRNILRSADDIRLWNRLARYDARHQTRFATQLDPGRPHEARPMVALEMDYLAHRSAQSPAEILSALVDRLRELEPQALVAEREELGPIIDELVRLGRNCQETLAALHEPRPQG